MIIRLTRSRSQPFLEFMDVVYRDPGFCPPTTRKHIPLNKSINFVLTRHAVVYKSLPLSYWAMFLERGSALNPMQFIIFYRGKMLKYHLHRPEAKRNESSTRSESHSLQMTGIPYTKALFRILHHSRGGPLNFYMVYFDKGKIFIRHIS